MKTQTLLLLSLSLSLSPTGPLIAQTLTSAPPLHRGQTLVPQARHNPASPSHPIVISSVRAEVRIVNQIATTTLDISLTNHSASPQEAEMVLPVPAGAVLRGFDFLGSASEPTAELLPVEQARRLYDSTVARMRDPALLEFIGHALVRSSVFPVDRSQGQIIRLVYEQLLPAEGSRLDYVLPRTESIDYHIPWQISVTLQSQNPIATVYSPSHPLHTSRSGPGTLQARLEPAGTTTPGPFRLSCLLENPGITASLQAYPDPSIGGGYFLLLAATPAKKPTETHVKREVILVLDRSGSMAGEKIDQVRAAALQVIEGLEDGEAFNILVYHSSVEAFASEPVIKNDETMKAARAYIKGIRIQGGTNLHDALLNALRQKPRSGFLPLVLFLTDGLPTVGQTSEIAIRNVATQANLHQRRIFTFGVGVDVNTPLLDRIASATRATATFVLPGEDVEVRLAQVFKRLAGPVLASPTLTLPGSSNVQTRATDVTPATLPDLFEDDQLVLIGRYRGTEPLKFRLEGDYFGEHRGFDFVFPLDNASTQNAFIPRLWASRQIATLTDAIRDLGADQNLQPLTPNATPAPIRELVDEIVRLSTEFGILTEYTAFLAREGTDLTRPEDVTRQARLEFENRAIRTRNGYGSVNQDLNNSLQRSISCINPSNAYLDPQLNRVTISTVQQINDRAFYRRGNRWIDSQLVHQTNPVPDRVVSFGTPEFRELVSSLAASHRQGCITLAGEILLRNNGQIILVR